MVSHDILWFTYIHSLLEMRCCFCSISSCVEGAALISKCVIYP